MAFAVMIIVLGIVIAAVFALYCWRWRIKKKGLWTREKSLSHDYMNAAMPTARLEIEEKQDQFDMHSTASMKTKMSLQSRKEKGSSVVGPDLEFELPGELDSEERTF